MPVLVYAENTDGQFKKSAHEVICYARAVADQLHTGLTAISIGEVDNSELSTLGKYGAEKVLNVPKAELKNFVNQAYASVIAAAAKSAGADVVILANSVAGKGIASRLAVKLNAGFAEGVVALPELEEKKFIVKKTAFSGKAFAFVELTSAKKVVTLSPNSWHISETGPPAAIENYSTDITISDFRVMIKEIVRETGKISLPEAEIVVAGGRGMKDAANWGLLEELADVLGAALACSKPVSDAGWRPHSEHVGQTGTAISPNMYIAVGISGAIQHLAGVSGSKVIVVINKDADAPFFKVADYGIVGDAFEVLPKLIAAVKEFKAVAQTELS